MCVSVSVCLCLCLCLCVFVCVSLSVSLCAGSVEKDNNSTTMNYCSGAFLYITVRFRLFGSLC